MERAHGQLIAFAVFEACKNSWGAIIKEGNEVGEAYEGVNFLPIYTGNPISIEFFAVHCFSFVKLFINENGRREAAGIVLEINKSFNVAPSAMALFVLS